MLTEHIPQYWIHLGPVMDQHPRRYEVHISLGDNANNGRAMRDRLSSFEQGHTRSSLITRIEGTSEGTSEGTVDESSSDSLRALEHYSDDRGSFGKLCKYLEAVAAAADDEPLIRCHCG